MSDTSIGSLADNGPMTGFQVAVVGICVIIGVLDGFDVLAMAFAAPAIAREWHLAQSATGTLLSVGLLGMAVGALFFSSLADLIGRRSTILLCLLLIGGGMVAAGFSRSLSALILVRLVAGLGIGAMGTTIGVMAVEYSSKRRRDLVISLISVAFPLGGIVGGAVAGLVLGAFGWRAIFFSGGLLTLAIFPIVLFAMPESLQYLAARQPRGALQRLNAIHRRMKLPPLAMLPSDDGQRTNNAMGLGAIFQRPLLQQTLLLTFAYFFFVSCFYFMASWVPKLITDLGHSDRQGISVSMVFSFGSVLGGLLMGAVVGRLDRKHTTVGLLITLAMLMAFFNWVGVHFGLLAVTGQAFLLSMVCLACSVGLGGMIMDAFPPAVRGTGVGVCFGGGRIGGACGPYLAGLLLSAGLDGTALCMVMAVPALVAAALIYRLS